MCFLAINEVSTFVPKRKAIWIGGLPCLPVTYCESWWSALESAGYQKWEGKQSVACGLLMPFYNLHSSVVSISVL